MSNNIITDNDVERQLYPDINHPYRTTKGVQEQGKKKIPNDFVWNVRDIKAYTDLGLTPPERLGRFEKRFLSRVDVSKGPIERTVMNLVRLKAPDYENNPDVKNPPRKEWLYYSERWTGLDWRGIPINPVAGHIEGVYTKQYTRARINEKTGEVDYNELDPTMAQKIYYIPYSKKKVDEIIANSANSDKDTIKYTIKFGTQDNPMGQYQQVESRNQFSYEQFCWPWEQVCKLHYKPTVEAYTEWINREKSKDGLTFEPT
jgi:hypothetical protein